MKNRYGGPLRSFVAERFHLKIYVDMVDTPAFHSDVIAYPAITVISREVPGTTRIAHRPAIDRATLATLAGLLKAPLLPNETSPVREIARVTNGSEPWLLESFDQMALIRRLEGAFPLLESVGCKVRIGVATGADKAFIGDFETLDVEPSRKLPLVTTKDIMTGEVKWRGQAFAKLIAAIELKSQVGPSFGNNFNNRTEEAIGTAHDLWTAYREEAFGKQPRPFVGWMMMVEDAPASRKPVRDSSPHFPVFEEFRGASYLTRYDLLCQRLVQEQLYTTAALIAAERSAIATGDFTELSSMTGLRAFVAALAGHVAAEAARLG